MLNPHLKNQKQCLQTIHRSLKQFAVAAAGPILARRNASVALLALLAPGLLVAQPVWVNSGYGPGNANDGHVWGTDAFSAIQDGVNAVAAGGTVNVAAGTFVEQLDISKDITVTGQGPGTVIQSPAALAVNYTYNGTANRAIVFIHDTANAVLQNLTVDGAVQGDANYRFLGVSFYHAGGHALNLTVQNVRLSDSMFGMQSGIGIYAENRGETTLRNVEVGNCQVMNCQKGGLTFNGNVAANAHDNRVVGVGPTGLIAQNGIQVGYGASGTVANNQISGFAYTGADAACGILVYQAGATISGNMLTSNQKAVSVVSPVTAMGPVTLNSFADCQVGVSYDGNTPTINAPSNWWGSASGPSNASSNSGGTGVAVSDGVVFIPWLGDGTDTQPGVMGFQPNLTPLGPTPTQVWVNLGYGTASSNDGHIWGYDAFNLIQDAVNHVSAGGTVNVTAGTYNESGGLFGITINKPLNLVGTDGANQTTYSGSAMYMLYVTSGGVTIQGLTVTDPAYNTQGWSGDGSGIWVGGSSVSGVRITQCVVHDLGDRAYGINCGPAGGLEIDHCTIYNIQGLAAAQCAPAGQEYADIATGILVWGSSSFADSVLIHDNVIHDLNALPQADGIRVTWLIQNGTIANNQITLPAGCRSAVSLGSSLGVGSMTIQGNTIAGSQNGLLLQSPSSQTVVNNQITGTGAGVHVLNSVASIYNNLLTANQDGVRVEGAATTPSFLMLNNFEGCQNGVISTPVTTVNALYNWWGSVSGPNNALNPGGNGVVAGNGVNFSPWLGDSTDYSTAVGYQPHMPPLYYVPDHLVFTAQPGIGGVNSLLSPQPVVQVIDAFGRVDTVFNGSVTIALGNNPSGATLSGGLTQPVVNGVATFSGLSIDKVGSYTLVASSASPIVAATSGSFDIAVPMQVWVNLSYGPGNPNDGHIWGYDAFNTVQAAIDAVAPGGVVRVAAGTFVEQLNIGKDIAVIGQGSTTVIQSPASLAVNYNYGGTDNRAIVFIHDTGNAVLKDLIVDGAAQGEGNYRFLGVSFYHASGRALSLLVENIKIGDPALFGMQTGYGIYAENRDEATPRNIEVSGCLVTGCQKGGIYFAGNVVANAHENTVVGAGPTSQIAQNGILLGWGASGLVKNNEVSGFIYTGADEACGILVYQAAGTILNNVLTGNQDAVYAEAIAPMAVMLNNLGGCQNGVIASGSAVNAVSNWWGSVSGPSNASNPGGTGVAVSDGVAFIPWLGDGTDTQPATGFQPNLAPLGPTPTQVWVNLGYGPTSPNDGHIWGYDAFNTVQAGIDAVAASGTVNVAAGTFVQQLNIGKDITVTGQGAGTVIQSPANLPVNYGDYQAVVFMHDTANAVLQNLTVDGAAQGDTYERFVGVSFYHASGKALNLTVKNIKLSDPTLFGMQTGYGVYADNRAGTAQCNVEVGGCVIADCQKGGIYYAGDVVANAHDNKVVGAGATGQIAQNGILLGWGASGMVRNNEVSGFIYTGADEACGILVYQATGTILNNVLTGNQDAVDVEAATARVNIMLNNFEGCQNGVTGTLGATVNAMYDWWGSVSGPNNALNPGGNGVVAGPGVNFGPWLGDGTDYDSALGFQPHMPPLYYAPDHLVFSVQPGTADMGCPLSAQPAVQVIDSNGGIDTVFNGSVTIALGNNASGATLGGVLTQPVVNGVATFYGLTLDKVGSYTLVAASASPIMAATSGSFSVTLPALVVPPDVTVTTAQSRDPYSTGQASAASSCASPVSVTITYNDDRSGLTGCNATGTIVRTWTATDAAGNSTNRQQTITVIDTTAPQFVSVPANIVTFSAPGKTTAVVSYLPTAKELAFSQGFEDAGWTSGDAANNPSVDWNNSSSRISRTASGTDGIVSRAGTSHAVIDSTGLAAGDSGAFSRLGGYSAVFGAGYRVAQDVYLSLDDAAVKNNTYGWDLSAASSTVSGDHNRDFIFHVASDAAGQLLVAADNNSGFAKPDLTGANHGTVTSNGWYTFEWIFRNQGGVLAVDCNLRAADGAQLWSRTLSTPDDVIAGNIGGNRYLWFTYLAVDKLAIDNTVLERFVSVTTDPPSGSTFPLGTNTVTATATDACGHTTTTSFTVAVLDSGRPVVSLLSCRGGKATVGVNGVAGYRVIIEASTNLVDWECVYTDSAPCTWVDTNAGAVGSRFYRAAYVP